MAAGAPPNLPVADLREFRHIRRYWDPVHTVHAAKILPGEYYVSTTGEAIVTVLGSCIAACVQDRKRGIGGMNHFMLPGNGPALRREKEIIHLSGKAAHYGSYAMERLINAILSRGGRREHLEAKVFGGVGVLNGVTDVGRRNVEFVHGYLHLEGIPLRAEDVGGERPRKVYYFPADGRVRVRRLRTLSNDTMAERESDYRRRIDSEPAVRWSCSVEGVTNSAHCAAPEDESSNEETDHG